LRRSEPGKDRVRVTRIEIAPERGPRREAHVDAGDRGVFVRISDSDPAMLRYLAQCGIAPGDKLEVRERQPFGGPLFVRFGKREHPIGGGLARAMRVELTTPRRSVTSGAD